MLSKRYHAHAVNRLTRIKLLTIGTPVAWGVLMALAWKPYLDPLSGVGLRGYIGYVGIHVALAGLIILTFYRHWRLFGSLLTFLALFCAFPMPSKPGVDGRVTNTSSISARVTVTPLSNAARHITLSVLPGETASYRSAPGDYSEAAQFAIKHGTSRLVATVADLRSHQVQLSDNTMLLVGNQPK